MNDLNEIRNECLKSLNESADSVLKYIEGDERNKHLKKLQTYVKTYCILDHQAQECERTFEREMEDHEEGTVSNIDEEFVKAIKSLASKKPNVENHPAMVRFQQKLSDLDKTHDESDIIETESTQAFLDPITKKQIVTPVINKHCSHVYEKSTITAILKKRAMFKCPVVGCANRKNIQQVDLILDEALKIRLSQMHTNATSDSD